jgi:hypothetical protein
MSWSRHAASTIGIDPGWAGVGVICFWCFAALAIAGALTSRGRTMPPFVAADPALLQLSVVFFIFETPRYRTGIDPFIVILTGVALVAGWDALAARVRPLSRAAPERRASADAAPPR